MSQPGEVMRGGSRRPLLPLSLGLVLALAAVLAVVGSRAGDDAEVPTAETVADDRPPPAEVARAYLDAWEAEDWVALQALTADQSLDAAAVHADAHRILRVQRTSARAGTPVVDGDRATVDAEITWDLGALGETTHTVELTLGRGPEGWRVRWWYPAIHPDLTPERRFQRVRVFRDRAPILGRDGEPLVRTQPQLAVTLDPAVVDDPEAVAAELVALADADPERVADVLAGDERQDVARVPLAEGEELREELEAVDGVGLRRTSARREVVPGLGALLGTVGDITAEGLEALGDPYAAGDVVGRSGLERVHERRLAGEPQLEARIVEGSQLVTTLAYRDGEAPQPIEVTLDAAVQEVGRAALEGTDRPAALVALDVPSGEVLAAVSVPDGDLPRAVEGRYAPGSTFKIVTAAAALAAGRGPGDEVDCPPVLRVGGRDLRNAGGDGPGTITLTDAMARSCNTAFAALAGDVGVEALTETAATFGFDAEYDPGLPAFGGRYPEPADAAELAASAIGQARVEASPLHMASVVAAAVSGTWRAPHVVRSDDLPEPRTLPDGVPATLRELLRAAVADGTGRAADLPGEPVYGKTGSAEFGSGPELATHAWFVAVRGDVAVAVVVEGGGGGGAVAAPLAADFLTRLEG